MPSVEQMPSKLRAGLIKSPKSLYDGMPLRSWRHRDSVGGGLIELLRTNDLVLISRVEAILAEIGLAVFVAVRHMSALEGSLSFLPRRVMVAADAAARARMALAEAGLGEELRDGWGSWRSPAPGRRRCVSRPPAPALSAGRRPPLRHRRRASRGGGAPPLFPRW